MDIATEPRIQGRARRRSGPGAGEIELTSVTDDVATSVAAIFRSESPRLVTMLWAVTGDRRQAEDLAQEAFARLYAQWHRLEDPTRAAAWLRVTALNLARSRFRHLAVVRRRPPLTDRPGASPEDDAVLSEDRARLVAALRRLPARQRECVVLRYFAEMSEGAIAVSTGLSTNSVKTHLRRGLASLERAMEDGR